MIKVNCLSNKQYNLTKVLDLKKDAKKTVKLEAIKAESEYVKEFTNRCEAVFNEDTPQKVKNLKRELVNIVDEQVINKIDNILNAGHLAKIIAAEECKYLIKLVKVNFDFLNFRDTDKFNKPVTLVFEQIFSSVMSKYAQFRLAVERAMHVPSKNPRVIAIENILKEQYGMKFVSLKDNEQIAIEVLRACETARKNRAKLPENIIVTPLLESSGEYLSNKTILLSANPDKHKLPYGYASTNASYHTVLHEIMHGNSFVDLYGFQVREIPKRFQDTKNNLSVYSKISNTDETYTELLTKRAVDGLNPKEELLYQHLSSAKK